tara:strand:- start:18631 stop:19443 length:813 start_codon:yes stop_codon:yes gene_type:complete
MPSEIFKTLLNSEIEKFKMYFSNTAQDLFYDEVKGKLFHTGEFGLYREKVVVPFLKMIIPQRLSVNTGFLITPKNNVSTQCDIVIYDRNSTPLIQDDSNQTFYPIETVIGIGEIKSTLSKSDFKKAINKLAKNKRLREDIVADEISTIKSTNPGKINLDYYNYDHIFSFLICEKLDFELEKLNFDDLYDVEINKNFRHNMILSIKDGLFLYFDEKITSYPISANLELDRNYLHKPTDDNPNEHFLAFSHYFFMSTESASIFYPEIVNYLH